jgi:hypothetical protein
MEGQVTVGVGVSVAVLARIPAVPVATPTVLTARQAVQVTEGGVRLELALDNRVMGWTGISIVYRLRKKRKPRKSQAA